MGRPRPRMRRWAARRLSRFCLPISRVRRRCSGVRGRTSTAGTGRSPRDHPIGAGWSQRPGSRYPGGRILRGVLLTAGVRGGGPGDAAGAGGVQWPVGGRVRVRMGVHTGEASQAAADLVGLDVHRAARVAAVAHGGQVLVSETAAALVARLAAAGRGAQGSGCAPAKGPGPAGADLPAARRRACRRSSRRCARSATRRWRTTCPPSWPRSSAGSRSWPRCGRSWVFSSGHADRGRRVRQDQAGPAGGRRAAGWVGDGVWLVELAAVTDEASVAPAISGRWA